MIKQPFFAPTAYDVGEFIIRAYQPGDGAALQRAATASYEHLRPWMLWARPDQSVEESEQICRRGAARYLLNEDFTLGIWMGDELAGGTGFHLRGGPLELRYAEIGMWISGARRQRLRYPRAGRAAGMGLHRMGLGAAGMALRLAQRRQRARGRKEWAAARGHAALGCARCGRRAPRYAYLWYSAQRVAGRLTNDERQLTTDERRTTNDESLRPGPRDTVLFVK